MVKSESFTHVDGRGRARMVNVGEKAVTRRQAEAEGVIRMQRSTFDAILADDVQKGDVLTVARLASIGGAKRTADLIPLCHPLALDGISVEIEPKPDVPGIRLGVLVTTESRTGVEMEAMCAVSVGLLAVYDMCKAMDRGMEIGPVRLVHKSGGTSGPWSRNDAEDG